MRRASFPSLLILGLLIFMVSAGSSSAQQRPIVQLTGATDKDTINVGELAHVTASVHNTGNVEARNLEFGAKADNAYIEHVAGQIPGGTSESLGPGTSIQFAFDVRGKAEGRGTIAAWVVYHDSQGNRYDFSNNEAVVIQVTTSTGYGSIVIYGGIAAIAVLAAAGVLILMRRRRLREERKPRIEVPGRMKYCISCRTELPIDAKFCDSCGAGQEK